MNWPARLVRGLSPAVARPAPREILRAALGCGAGITGCGLLAQLHGAAAPTGAPLLIAPLGATAFLLFCVPNSPLAQPWSALIGNGVSALVAVAVVLTVAATPLAVGLAVTLSVLAMMLLRAMHPPGAAVALLIALTPTIARDRGFGFALDPVALDTAVLVGLAIAFNRATGRKYPFRQPAAQNVHGTRDSAPDRRLGLSADDLARLLRDMNLAANIGAEDLARLIGAAEAEAASRHLGGLTAADVMSRDLVTVAPSAHPGAMTELFRARGFKTLPVVSPEGDYLGLLSLADLLGGDGRDEVEQIMSTSFQTVPPDMPLAPLLAILAQGAQQAVPVLAGRRLVGIVTRTDMIGALAHALNG